MICANCSTELNDTVKFCPKCGYQVIQDAQAAIVKENQTKTCPSCGTQNPSWAKFCKHDGTQLPEIEASKPEQSPSVRVREPVSESVSPLAGQEPARTEEPTQPQLREVQAPDGQEIAARVCPVCNALYPLGAKFCRKDGSTLRLREGTKEEPAIISKEEVPCLPEPTLSQQVPEAVGIAEQTLSKGIAEEGSLCPKCGTRNSVGVRFCKNDGLALSGAPITGPAQTADQESSVTELEKPPEEAADSLEGQPRRGQRRRWFAIASVLFLLAAGIGGGSYWYLFIKKPGDLRHVLNSQLRAQNLNVQAEVSKDLSVTLKGLTANGEMRTKVLEIAKANPSVRQVIDRMSDLSEIRGKLAGVSAAIGATKNAVGSQYKSNGSIGDAGGRDAIGKTYGVDVPDDFAVLSVDKAGVITAVIRNVADEVNNRTMTATPDRSYEDWKLTTTIEATYFTVADMEQNMPKPQLERGLPEAREPDILTAPKLTKPSRVTTRDSVPQKVKRTPADASKIEAEMNRLLRKEGLLGITAEVSNDMVVTLKGTARDQHDKRRALSIAKGFKNIQGVRDIIFLVGS